MFSVCLFWVGLASATGEAALTIQNNSSCTLNMYYNQSHQMASWLPPQVILPHSTQSMTIAFEEDMVRTVLEDEADVTYVAHCPNEIQDQFDIHAWYKSNYYHSLPVLRLENVSYNGGILLMPSAGIPWQEHMMLTINDGYAFETAVPEAPVLLPSDETHPPLIDPNE